MNIRNHTALHVLKGAVRKVLGDDAKWTASVHTSDTGGRLIVQFYRKPTEEEIKLIESEANGIITKNIPVINYSMSRQTAKERYGDEHLDLFPIPKNITNFSIIEIKDWNVNACNQPHTETTGQIGKIKIRKVRFRNNKQLLEISFIVS